MLRFLWFNSYSVYEFIHKGFKTSKLVNYKQLERAGQESVYSDSQPFALNLETNFQSRTLDFQYLISHLPIPHLPIPHADSDPSTRALP